MHKTTSTDDKRLQSTLKRLGVNTIPGIEEVRLGWEWGVCPLGPSGAGGWLRRGVRLDARRGFPRPCGCQTSQLCACAASALDMPTQPCRSTTTAWCRSSSTPLTSLARLPPAPPLDYWQVLLINNDGSALQFNNPKVQASIAANTYVVSGASQPKRECPCAPPASACFPACQCLPWPMAAHTTHVRSLYPSPKRLPPKQAPRT